MYPFFSGPLKFFPWIIDIALVAKPTYKLRSSYKRTITMIHMEKLFEDNRSDLNIDRFSLIRNELKGFIIRKAPSLLQATKPPLPLDGLALLHIHLSDRSIQKNFWIIPNFAFDVLLCTSFKEYFIRCIFTAKKDSYNDTLNQSP